MPYLWTKGSMINMSRKAQPEVTVIVVHYRGLGNLRRCLESLFQTRYKNFRVILVDNGSEDGSFEYVKRTYSDEVDVIRSKLNLGFVAGSNLGLRQAESKYVVLLNDDTVVDPDWLKNLVDVAERDESIGACQPKLVSLVNPRYFEYNGACGGMLDVYGVPLCRGRIFDSIEEDNGQYDLTVDVFWASGAAMFIKNHVLNEAGLLDEILYAHMEEIDLSWRMRLLGYKITCVPKSVVYHLGGGTPLPEKLYLKHRNNLIVMLKNYSPVSLLRFFLPRTFLDVMSVVYFFFKKEHSRVLSVLRSYLWLFRNLRKVYESRCYAQKRRKIKDEEITAAMVKKSVAIQYYIMGRGFFSQLGGLPNSLGYYVGTLRRE